jgi:phosphatidylserine decarboxylase
MDAFVLLQHLLPKHGLSRLAGAIADSSTRRGLMAPFVRWGIRHFVRKYAVDLAEAERTQLSDYDSFNDFFTRALKPGARPVDARADIVVSPSDGRLGQHGPIHDGLLVQAKGHRYRVAELLASEDYARAFAGGWFVTIYLAPSDYHRVHSPEDATLDHATYVPGELFSVNPRTEAGVPGLFARNERLVCALRTAHGPLALTMVGALIVSGIETVWQVGPTPDHTASHAPVTLARGGEIGQFRLGSTVVLCLPPGTYRLADGVRAGEPVRMGAPLLQRSG